MRKKDLRLKVLMFCLISVLGSVGVLTGCKQSPADKPSTEATTEAAGGLIVDEGGYVDDIGENEELVIEDGK